MRTLVRLVVCFLCWITSIVFASDQTIANGAEPVVRPIAAKESPYAVVARGPNHRVWQKTTYEIGPAGEKVPKIHEYVELASGLHYMNAAGEWEDTKEEFEILPGKVRATQGQYKVSLNYNLNSAGAVEMTTPDGKQLNSHVLGLAYFDTSTGESVLIAEVKDCVGEVSGNQVVYLDAFTDFKADVRYTYRKSGFEQDIVLGERPPGPEEYGLDPNTTRLQVLTEFIEAPEPQLNAQRMVRSEGQGLQDEELSFGTTILGRGKAFSTDHTESRLGIPVGKHWLNLDGRDFLLEEVAMPALQDALRKLPSRNDGASIRTTPGSTLHVVSATRLLPGPKLVKAGTREMKTAAISPRLKGFVLDYQTINGNTNDFVFKGDSTYLISGGFNISGRATFEGGTVIKCDNAAGLIILNEPPLWLTEQYRPAVFTSANDNSVGELISGSTGDPQQGDAGLIIEMDVGSLVKHARFSFGTLAIWGCNLEISHSQFINCGTALVEASGGTFLRNNLFSDCGTIIMQDGSSPMALSGEHLTVDLAESFAPDVTTGGVTNSILNRVSGATNGVGYFSCLVTNSPVGVFEAVGGGKYYLATNSSYRDVGTTNINPDLLADLRKRTTFPPVVCSNLTFLANTNFNQHAQRDTDQPDIGYHYDPLDYTFGGCTANSNIKFTAGTAVGWFRTSSGWANAGQGINLGDLHEASFEGSASAPCVWARANTVQEQDYSGGYGPGGITGSAYDDWLAATVRLRYTKCSMVNSDANHFRDDNGFLIVRASNSEFYSGGLGGYGISLYLTNCLFDRNYVAKHCDCSGDVVLRNCLIRGRGLTLQHWEYDYTAWESTVRDTVFDGAGLNLTPVYVWSSEVEDYVEEWDSFDFDYNAYTNASNPFPIGGNNDVPGVDFNWQRGALGDYYQPTNSPLKNGGSLADAGLVGLSYFTTFTNQELEAATRLDIGYHYMALDASDKPVDNDEDGVPSFMDAAPDDPFVGTLSITIDSPLNGASLN